MPSAASKALFAAIVAAALSPINTVAQAVQRNPILVPPSQFGVSPPVRQIVPREQAGGPPAIVKPPRPLPRPQHPLVADPVVQSAYTTAVAPSTNDDFVGLGNGFPNYTVNLAPSDVNLAVGPNDIVQVVNISFAVFSKTGSLVSGPTAFSSLFSTLSNCVRSSYSDPIVLYDRQADRWLLAILGYDSSSGPFYHCIAVSTSSDPSGSYNLYSFPSSTGSSNLPDYPKMGVWPDAYYVTYNMFNGNTLQNAQICAHDRAAMLAGQPEPTAQCFFTPSASNYGLLPASLDGATAPPTGSLEYLLSLAATPNNLSLWTFHVDWTTPANSTFTGPTNIAVAAFNEACTNGGTCIPQAGTTTQLDSLGDRLMYRLAYRNFGDHESLVVSHAVNTGTITGERWYEIRSPGSNPVVYQQGTYAPDSNHRWMGSIAMDGSGDIGLGFSISSGSIHPGIHYTGRLVSDPIGILPQGEGSIIDGAYSQTTYTGFCLPSFQCPLTRWGDYTAMQVDPSDDCTFWYTDQYIPLSNGTFNWGTRIANFKFPSCGANLTASTTTLTANPLSPSTYGTTVQFTATVSGKAGTPTGTVTFMDGNTSLGSQTLSSGTAALSTSALVAGQHQITASYGGDPTYSGSNSSALAYSVSQAGTTTTITSSNANSTQGQSVTFTATVSSATSGTPTGTVTFFSNGASIGSGTLSGGVAKLSTSSLPIGSDTITAQYGGDSNFTASTSPGITQTVTATPADFTIAASPTSASVRAGKTASYTVTITASGGFTGTVQLSASVNPSGPRPTFSPSGVSGSGSSTMKVSTSGAARGTYKITITGTSGALVHSVQVTLQVR